MRGGQVTDNRRTDGQAIARVSCSRSSNVIHKCIASHYLFVLFSICITALVVINVNQLTWQRLRNFTPSPGITTNNDYIRCAERLLINSLEFGRLKRRWQPWLAVTGPVTDDDLCYRPTGRRDDASWGVPNRHIFTPRLCHRFWFKVHKCFHSSK